ncbi:MAG: DNA polymerase III subunit chi [Pseudomonadota bacterium]
MGAAYFYHLTRGTLEDTLRLLLGKSLEAGWRVAVCGTDAARLDHLDAVLWLGPEEGFLPHGRAGGPQDARQPILLTDAVDAPNAPDCVMSIDGAEIAAADVARLERVCILFDGNDDDAVARARVQWKTLADAGAAAQYWSEESGRWEKKAQTGVAV